jgi:hypothetical protein
LEGIVLARKEKCRRWQPLMIISLFPSYQPSDGWRTGSGLEGVSIHSSRHTNAPLSRTNNNPDLSCHILTSSPSIQIKSGFFPSSSLRSLAYLRRRFGHDPTCLSLSSNLSSSPSTINGPLCSIRPALSTVYRSLIPSRTRLSLLPMDAHEVPPRTECPSPAEFACDARSCCQIAQRRELGRHSIHSIPAGHGGSHSPSACAQGMFAFDARALVGAHSSTAEDDCCSDCTPCLIHSASNACREDNAATECRGHSARGKTCPIPTGSISDIENNVAPATTEGYCCRTLECHLARGQVYPIDTNSAEKETEKEDIVVISTVNTRACF